MYMTATNASAPAGWLEEILKKITGFFPKRNPRDVGPWDQK